jgi:hypothetical protein
LGNAPFSLANLLGCSGEQLAEHLERQFTAAQTWANYGTAWHMDHVVAICAPGDDGPPTLIEKIGRLHWTNIQPLSVDAHLAKTADEARARAATPERPVGPPLDEVEQYLAELLAA